MENASKALLIAAAILIVIILIAFGMNVLNSTSDVGDKATTTGNQLSDYTNRAANKVNHTLTGMDGWLD